jgi:hypothetical protein
MKMIDRDKIHIGIRNGGLSGAPSKQKVLSGLGALKEDAAPMDPGV